MREFLCYNLGNTTLGLYSVFVLVELILHTIRQKRLEKQTGNHFTKEKMTDLAGVQD
ncbi:MAG: hypothetical protein UDD43_06580 [Agathobacter sp.]|nr:hypothetical protein [Agathobacter sp.]